MNLEKEINKIQKKFKPRDYGLKNILDIPIMYSNTYFNNQELVLNMSSIKSIKEQKEFDCLTSSIIANEILGNAGFSSQIFVGMDEKEIWKNHTYLKVEDGIVDFTPHYPTLGAEHPTGTPLTNQELEIYNKPYKLSIVGSSLPLSYSSDSTLLLGFREHNNKLIRFRDHHLPALNLELLMPIFNNGKWSLKKIDSKLGKNVLGKTVRQLYPDVEKFIPTQ